MIKIEMRICPSLDSIKMAKVLLTETESCIETFCIEEAKEKIISDYKETLSGNFEEKVEFLRKRGNNKDILCWKHPDIRLTLVED